MKHYRPCAAALRRISSHRQIFLAGGDEPAIAERVFDPADAIAIKLIGHWADELCPRRHGTFDRTIDILDVEMNGDGRTADGLRAEGSDLRVLVGQHERGNPRS